MIRNIIDRLDQIINEDKQTLSLNKLPYKTTDLEPVKSKETLDYHYAHLARGYVDRYNKGEGDPDFNEAGAYLHNLYFPQFMPPKSGNKPSGACATLIDSKFGSFKELQDEMKTVAMGIQGSGWVYLSRSGEIKTIKNHQIKRDIALLIDWWEHAWALDYQSDKAQYLKNIWRIINWDVVNQRL